MRQYNHSIYFFVHQELGRRNVYQRKAEILAFIFACGFQLVEAILTERWSNATKKKGSWNNLDVFLVDGIVELCQWEDEAESSHAIAIASDISNANISNFIGQIQIIFRWWKGH